MKSLLVLTCLVAVCLVATEAASIDTRAFKNLLETLLDTRSGCSLGTDCTKDGVATAGYCHYDTDGVKRCLLKCTQRQVGDSCTGATATKRCQQATAGGQKVCKAASSKRAVLEELDTRSGCSLGTDCTKDGVATAGYCHYDTDGVKKCLLKCTQRQVGDSCTGATATKRCQQATAGGQKVCKAASSKRAVFGELERRTSPCSGKSDGDDCTRDNVNGKCGTISSGALRCLKRCASSKSVGDSCVTCPQGSSCHCATFNSVIVCRNDNSKKRTVLGDLMELVKKWE